MTDTTDISGYGYANAELNDSHGYHPRRYARTLLSLLEPGGIAIVSTPYHGYWKNLVLALTGKMDAHFHALWDHGHIKVLVDPDPGAAAGGGRLRLSSVRAGGTGPAACQVDGSYRPETRMKMPCN